MMPDFQTKMGIFEHDVADLGESVLFNSISLAGALRPIKVDVRLLFTYIAYNLLLIILQLLSR